MNTVVHTFYQKQAQLKEYFESRQEISLAQDVEETFRKSLALAAGSFFENEMILLLEEFARAKSSNCESLISLVKNKALSRQYHTFFKWDARNANGFFGLLGEAFRDRIKKRIEREPEIQTAIENFLDLGELRNMAAHQNFASFTTDKTSQEIMQSFESARRFLVVLREELHSQ
jgi:hypothetical protein